MAAHHKHRFWRICRIYFRRFRITVWFAILAFLLALFYLNQIGLPGVIKKPVLEKLRARGIDLQFTRLRLRWFEGIVADNVRFGRADEPLSPQLTLREVQVRLNPRALSRLQFQIDALVLRRGRLLWPLSETNQPRRELTVNNIQTELRFLPDDQWALDHFRADFSGANIQLSGVVTNASAVRDWKLFQPQPPGAAADWSNRLRQLADTLQRIHFSAPPELRLEVHGDARDLASFGLRISLAAPGADTPWGAVSQGRFVGRLFPAATNSLSHAELNLEAVSAKTPWAAITNFALRIHLAAREGQTNLLRGELRLSAGQVNTEWGDGANVLLTAQWLHAITNLVPLSGEGRLECDHAQTKWVAASHVQFAGDFATARPGEPPAPADACWGWWTNLQPYSLDWEGRLTDFQSSTLQAEEVAGGGSWRAPQLTVTNLEAKLYGGAFEARAHLDVATRALDLSLNSDFDLHHISPRLNTRGEDPLAQVSWPKPPQLKAAVALTFPAWTNSEAFRNWQTEVEPTLAVQGEFNLDQGGAYREMQFTGARSQFSYSNHCWRLPDLELTRPEGRLTAEYWSDARAQDFSARISSSMDVLILRPLLQTNEQRALDLFGFTQAPVLEAEVRGRFHELERIGFNGQLRLTNFTFRGETASSLQTGFQYTNRLLQILDPRLERGTQRLRADGLAADFNAQVIYLTNGFSTADPMVVARAIGPQIVRAIEPYQFSQPPTAHVHGVIPLRGVADADLHFDLDGDSLHWWKFNFPHAAGHVHWAGQYLTLSDVRLDFYGGEASASASFDFTPPQGNDFQFKFSTTNTLLQALMADVSTRTNHLEGRLDANLVVAKANTDNLRAVDGYGSLDLRDGLIWDIRLFGILSPVLNGISPGLGNSRATAAACTFIITNGVIRSDDLEIRSTAMRLQYRGTVGLDGQVNARAEAEPLRDIWLVGPIFSTVVWPVTKFFETKITGTLDDPKTGPVNPLTTLMLAPLHPFRTIRGLLPEEPNPAHTNSPPMLK